MATPQKHLMIKTKKYSLVLLAVFLFSAKKESFSQLPNKVGSLLTAERTINRLAAEYTPHNALLSVTDKETVFLSPGPVNGLTFLKNRPNIPDLMTWEPAFSGISKSMELGFTVGPINFQRVGSPRRYGEYITIWKRDRKGEWKIALRGIVENYGNTANKNPEAVHVIDQSFIEPDSVAYYKQRSQARLNQRTDIVSSNDRLFATVLRSDNRYAYQEFLTEDARFYFPWTNPIIGKQGVIDFITEKNIHIETEFTHVDRAYSGELAYTYGSATVRTPNNELLSHNYVRVWQRQRDHQWRVIVEFYSER